jgi:RNA polymerase sigma factor (sigma-70 family)
MSAATPRGAPPLVSGGVQPDAHAGASSAVLRTLVANRARFLAFLERRVGGRADAEEILQEAFSRGVARGGALRAEESAVAWFYRTLRNAIVDHERHAAAERRGLAAFGAQADARADDAADAELVDTICACVASLVDTLKPEYAVALRRVELGGESVGAFARDVGITPGNAGVRVFRARQALRRRVEESCGACADHGCWQCECRDERHGPGAAPAATASRRRSG